VLKAERGAVSIDGDDLAVEHHRVCEPPCVERASLDDLRNCGVLSWPSLDHNVTLDSLARRDARHGANAVVLRLVTIELETSGAGPTLASIGATNARAAGSWERATSAS
jgi:hypothetical protein